MFLKKISLLAILITAITGTTMAQKDTEYKSQWKKVEALEKKGLPASALKEVLAIYNLSVKENNDVQQIKSCLYQVKYRSIFEEESQEKNIFFLDTLLAKAAAPAKNILQSMQAEMLWQYVQNNRWKLYDRTKLAAEKSRDISTWSLDKLHSTITKLYQASIDVKSELLLKQTKLDGFDPILIKGKNTRQLRPTLYDFLAFRALEYFMTDEPDITKPAYQFAIKDPLAFAPAKEFIQHHFETKDSASLHYHALQLLQDILSFHTADTKNDALLDADLARLNFVNQYAVNEDKEKLYEAALRNIEEKFSNHEATAQAMYLRAKIYYDNATEEEDEKAVHQYDIKRAKELCDAAVASFPESEGGINAANLILTILKPSLQLETEKVNLPVQPFRSLVKYKNVPTVYFRIIKTSNSEIEKLEKNENDSTWEKITSLKPLKSWQVEMPDPKDFMEHSTEIKVDAAAIGTYYLLASVDKNFALEKNIIAKQVVYVSNIAGIHCNDDYYIMHRETGMPLAGAKIQVWENTYNYKTSRYENKKTDAYTADKNGHFKIKKSKEYRATSLQITTATDELHITEDSYDYYYDRDKESAAIKPYTFLFMDRSIYRPGQTIYFKGIVIQLDKDAGKTKIVPGFSTLIQLNDANGQKLKGLKVVSNSYGSYHGSFKLPEGSLNGNFSIFDTTTKGSNNFNVEEYKRPKFLVTVPKPSGTYRVNDSITVTGNAKGYAGNNIDGAAVKYRVVRKVEYPVWWGWGGYIRKGGRIPYGNNNEVEITNGTATTDSKGEFRIQFKALPDESISKKDQPTFYYEVSADITDMNGETRSGETSVAVAYQALQLEIILDDKLPADSFKQLLVRSTNLNDIEEQTMVTVSILQLKSPEKIFRERYWAEPDQFVMSKDEYYSYFPYDVYKNEDEVKNYIAGGKLVEKTDSSNGPLKLENGKWKEGWYKIIALAKDKFGEEVRSEKYILLTGNETIPASPIAINITKGQAEPGEQINYTIATGFDKIWLIQKESRQNIESAPLIDSLQQPYPFKKVSIPVYEADRGGMQFSFAFVKHNRVYKDNERFEIPWSNKELNINYETFRDKLLPGANETWTVKISGRKGQKAAAEILAGMYDASLDQFSPHAWNKLSVWPSLYDNSDWKETGFGAENSDAGGDWEIDETYYTKIYDVLSKGEGMEGRILFSKGSLPRMKYLSYGTMADVSGNNAVAFSYTPAKVVKDEEVMGNTNFSLNGTTTDSSKTILPKEAINPETKIRKNFNETAFFFPDLSTDAEGNVSFSFTMPEALTEWKLMTLAHTKDLASAYSEKKVITQKPLMVQPNAPRFMREGDHMEFSAKIVNLSDSELTGTTTLELLDAATNQPVDGWFKNIFPNQYFTAAAGQSAVVKFPIDIPFNFSSALTYRIVVKAASFSDGEEMALPVLANRMLVTESMPLNLRSNEKNKQFKFEKLVNSCSSKTISNHALTVEYSSNPAWYAVQALPYLMEYPYECAEQTFNRYYANILAAYISNSIPKIKSVFEKWKTTDTAALLSNLQKNEELKSALLQETPWVLDAQNETQQKKNIALLFDMVRMSSETTKNLDKLKEMQIENGGFVWFKGGPDDRYITQYIITGIGHLKKLNALSANETQQLKDIMGIVKKGIPYLDKKIKADYDYLVKNKVKLNWNNLNDIIIQYLYMRSLFTETAIPAASQKAYNYYLNQSRQYWLKNSKYMQAMSALVLQRNNDTKTAAAIIRSLKENSINSEEMGMYWKEWNNGGWFWHQAPIESQAMMIEAFTEIDKKPSTIDDLKTWLLKQKQTQNWKTTKATAEACYALLLNGSDWLGYGANPTIQIQLGSTTIQTDVDSAEAGTGYFREKIDGKQINPGMGNIQVERSQSPLSSTINSLPPGWGAVYWQYFEDLDKITPSATPLKLSKQLFVEKNSDKGPVLEALEDGATIKVGDKIKVRIELKVDRDMEYVHMKDMRGSCMEPVNVLSGYKYQGGLGYYESTKDASTNFFFSWLNKGTYVFEYPLLVTHQGNFSNGITTIQCMYAPEFTSHSEGVRVIVK